jgi:hypothetical protein
VGDRKPAPVILFAAAAGALFLAALVLVFFVSMKKDSNEELCRVNLTVIGMSIRDGALPSSEKWDAAGRGREFFANKDKWPRYQQIDFDPCCPVKGTRTEIDYRGPAKFLRELKNDEPMAADRPGNHGAGKGGNVLIKTGQVYTVPETHALWSAAARTTSD